MNNINWELRSKAALIHASFSLIVGSILLALVFLGWYPAALTYAMGVINIILILIGVDLALGPLLTFIIFNPLKKTLKIDLSIVILIQLAGLTYGIYTIFQGRPVWIVFVQDRFEIIRTIDVDLTYLYDVKVSTSWYKPTWAALPIMDQETKDVYFTEFLSGQPDVSFRANMFQNFPRFPSEIHQIARPLNELYQTNQTDAVNEVLAQYPNAISWFPLQATEKDLVVLLTNDNTLPQIVGLLPW